MQAITETVSQANDRDLERRVVNFLHDRHVPSLRRLEVEADNGTVIVRGRVSSFYEKQLCQAVCRRVAGVVRYLDEIDVVDTNRRKRALVK